MYATIKIALLFSVYVVMICLSVAFVISVADGVVTLALAMSHHRGTAQ